MLKTQTIITDSNTKLCLLTTTIRNMNTDDEWSLFAIDCTLVVIVMVCLTVGIAI